MAGLGARRVPALFTRVGIEAWILEPELNAVEITLDNHQILNEKQHQILNEKKKNLNKKSSTDIIVYNFIASSELLNDSGTSIFE